MLQFVAVYVILMEMKGGLRLMSNSRKKQPTPPEIPKKKRGPASSRPDPDELIWRYKNSTCYELAELYGVSPATVRSWVSRLRKEREQK